MQLEKYCSQITHETGAVINIDTSGHPAFSFVEALKLAPDFRVHHGAFCVWARGNDGFKICSQNKKRSREVASRGRSFCGICPWGIWELAVPVKTTKRFSIVVYLGHFLLADSMPKPLNGKIYSGSLPSVVTPEKKALLKHYGHFIAEFIRLELAVFVEDNKYKTKHQSEEYYCMHCEDFIAERYAENISLNQLAENLRLNPNYLGGLLMKKNGKTFRQLLTQKRLYVASLLLAMNGELNVSQIADMCGFCDSNYFCKVFSAKFAISPRRFRLRHYSGYRRSAP